MRVACPRESWLNVIIRVVGNLDVCEVERLATLAKQASQSAAGSPRTARSAAIVRMHVSASIVAASPHPTSQEPALLNYREPQPQRRDDKGIANRRIVSRTRM